MSRIAREHPDDSESWQQPLRFVPRVRRCYCGRSVSWDGVFCAEHDDGPEPKEESA